MPKTMSKAEIDAEIARLQALKASAPEKVWPKTIAYYLNGSKERSRDKGEELGLSDDTIDNAFLYCCYEVELTLVVHENGWAQCTHLNGVELKTPVTVAGEPALEKAAR